MAARFQRQHAFAAHRFLPGLGLASGAVRHSLRGGLSLSSSTDSTSASNRLKTFVEKAALASLFGDVFDDAATGQGLLNFFLRGIACGAITEEEALATGLTLEELRSRSFLKILAEPAEIDEWRDRVSAERQARSSRLASRPTSRCSNGCGASGLTGSKEGCAEGDCGACSVAIVDRDARGKRCYRAINSCLVPLPLMAGRDIVTVEGVARGRSCIPCSRRWWKISDRNAATARPGSSCRCSKATTAKISRPRAQLDEQLCGNLCRCTGYRPIRDAAADAFAQRGAPDEFDAQLKSAKTKLECRSLCERRRNIPPPDLAREIVRARMAQYPEARLIAGATELGLEITKQFQRFPVAHFGRGDSGTDRDRVPPITSGRSARRSR